MYCNSRKGITWKQTVCNKTASAIMQIMYGCHTQLVSGAYHVLAVGRRSGFCSLVIVNFCWPLAPTKFAKPPIGTLELLEPSQSELRMLHRWVNLTFQSQTAKARHGLFDCTRVPAPKTTEMYKHSNSTHTSQLLRVHGQASNIISWWNYYYITETDLMYSIQLGFWI